ncbi:Adenosylhomocysteinase [Paraburkholderia tropica]|nr:Adenosylhomocysteinase [Paraburkholderia tropica]
MRAGGAKRRERGMQRGPNGGTAARRARAHAARLPAMLPNGPWRGRLLARGVRRRLDGAAARPGAHVGKRRRSSARLSNLRAEVSPDSPPGRAA